MGAKVAMDFTSDKYSAPMAIKEIKILGAILELPAKGHLISKVFGVNLAIYLKNEQNGLNWQWCKADA